ncbi:MAG TPA: hypothetical protein VKU01_25160 [Bryobacteraceae bacterium]|nr:hypothetical protein [Bryobacteraceae bacterium]
MTLAKKQAYWLFVLLALCTYTAVFSIARSPRALVHPAAIGWGGLADLLITVPALFYFLVVRAGFSSWMTLVLVFFAGARAAGFILTAPEQAYLPALRWLGVPLELWIIASIVRRFRRMDRSGDSVTRIRAASQALFRYEWLSRLFASELEVLYYALFSGRARPDTRDGYRAFSYGEASGFGMFILIIGAGIFFESVPVHLILHRWSAVAAWIMTALDVYGLIWLVAIGRALRLRPILVGEDRVLIRVGLIWEVEFRRDQVAHCHRVAGPPPNRREPGYLSAVVLNEPQWLIELKEPVTAHGLLGRRREVTRIGLAVDESPGFGQAFGNATFK